MMIANRKRSKRSSAYWIESFSLTGRIKMSNWAGSVPNSCVASRRLRRGTVSDRPTEGKFRPSCGADEVIE
jgi:hypothetical protein